MDGRIRWWSVVQAVAWIVGRSLPLVERASGIRTFAALRRLQELKPVSVGDDPPVSLDAAPAELDRAAREERVGIYGRRGRGPPARVSLRGHLQTPWLADHGNEVRLSNEQMARTGDYWADLWVLPDECMNRWPADPIAGTTSPESRPATAPARKPTYQQEVEYSPDRVPKQFQQWAKKQHKAEGIVTEQMALDAMLGPKDATGKRSGGKLAPGKHLSRATVRAWLHRLPQEWRAAKGERPTRRRP